MKIIKGDLVLTKHTTFNEDLKVEGNVRCEGGIWNLNCLDLTCGNLTCSDLNCRNLTYYAVAMAYKSMKVKSIKGRRVNSKHFCLDKEIEFIKGFFNLTEEDLGDTD